MTRRILFRYNRRYWGLAREDWRGTPIAHWVPPVGSFVKLACTHWNDYQVGGWLKPNLREVTGVRAPTPQEIADLDLQGEYVIVEVKYSRRKHVDPTPMPLRVVFWWRCPVREAR